MKKSIFTILVLLLTTAVFAQAYLPSSARAEQLNKQYCSGLFSTPEAVYFDLESDAAVYGANSYFNVLDWMQGRVAGLQVYNYRGLKIPVIRNQMAAVYLDEMRVDYGMLNALPVNDIAMIKVIKTPFAGLWGAPGGAIAIYTKDGESEEEEEDQE
jgi:outer membrane receptor protein involved in Fe transport